MGEALMVDEHVSNGPTESPTFVVTRLRLVQLREWWPTLRPWLASALEQGMNVPAEALYAGALQEQVQLWVALREAKPHGRVDPVGAAATQVIDYGSGLSALRVIALAGEDFGPWRSLIIDEFEAFAREVRAQTIECVGRKGWIRSLARYGFESKYAICTKEVQQ